MNIHDIAKNALHTALVWFRPTGANGRTLGTGNMGHIYRLARNTNALDTIGEPYRRYWRPWSESSLAPGCSTTTPICGPLKTRSRWARLSGYWGWGTIHCAACRRLADTEATHESVGELNQADPWNQIRHDDRATTPDPVTGL